MMILTIFLQKAILGLSHTLTDKLFDDCFVAVCQDQGVEMDAGGKSWPRYCYKCPEGEDEVVFLREYSLAGWKYVLGEHGKFDGRYLLSVRPCGDVEVDSMGNVWTTWCYQDNLVKFEKMGGRIWVYKQDFIGGYPQLQFRRILMDSEFLQTFKEQFVKSLHEGKECEEELKGKTDQKEHRKHSSKSDAGKDKGKESNLSEKTKSDEKEDKLVRVSQSVKLDLEEDIKTRSSVETGRNASMSENSLESENERSYSLDITISHLEPETVVVGHGSDKTQTFDSSSLLTVQEESCNGDMSEDKQKNQKNDEQKDKDEEENEECEEKEGKNKENQEKEDKNKEIETKNKENEEKNENNKGKKCRNLEGDRSSRYFMQEFSDSGEKIEFALDKLKNFILNPETHKRIPLIPQKHTEQLDDSLTICKQYNSEGTEMEFEPDSLIKNMYWEVKYDDKRIKYLRSYLTQDKESGMYLIDCDTGYRLRAFI